MRQQAYINISGVSVNSNKVDNYFEVNAAQYTSHYQNNSTLSVLPVRGHFNLKKYRTNKPIPFDNTYVSVEGFLGDIETDSAGRATLFHMWVDNINFLGRAPFSPSIASGLGKATPIPFLCPSWQ
jgi:hypothetical protein